MNPFERSALSIEGSAYRWTDVLLAMCLMGNWPTLERQIRFGLACEQRSTDGEVFPRAAEQEEESRFRRERNLLSADDTEAWLKHRGIDTAEWRGWIRRAAMRSAWSDRVDAILADAEVADEDVDRVLWVEGVCSGAYPEAAERLARQAAVHAWAREQTLPTETDERAAGELLKRIPRRVSEQGLPGLAPAEVHARASSLASVLTVAERVMSEACSPAALETEVTSHAAAWLRVDFQMAVFPGESAAREAVLLVSEDGGELREAARMAGVRTETRSVYLDEVDSVLRSRLLAIPPGQALGPLPAEDGYQVLTIDRRVEPSLDDPAVLRRASHRVMSRFADREVAPRVQWHDTL
jgi:hypothetical protein